MAWSEYIRTLLGSADCITKGAIIGDDGSIWARSEPPNGQLLNISAQEAQALSQIWHNIESAPQTGLNLEGQKYIVPRIDAEEKFILGKKGAAGLMAVKTTRACVIALFNGETQEGQKCRKAVDYIANYLKQAGY